MGHPVSHSIVTPGTLTARIRQLIVDNPPTKVFVIPKLRPGGSTTDAYARQIFHESSEVVGAVIDPDEWFNRTAFSAAANHYLVATLRRP